MVSYKDYITYKKTYSLTEWQNLLGKDLNKSTVEISGLFLCRTTMATKCSVTYQILVAACLNHKEENLDCILKLFKKVVLATEGNMCSLTSM